MAALSGIAPPLSLSKILPLFSRMGKNIYQVQEDFGDTVCR